MNDCHAERTWIVSRLLQDDRDYFAAGASSRAISGGTLHWMPGLQHLAAGCMVEPQSPQRSPDLWAAQAADAVRRIGSPLLRLYLEDANPAWETGLAAAGLTSIVELAMARRAEPGAGDPEILPELRIREIVGRKDWTAKQRLAAALDTLPDGKDAPAAEWTELERRKSEAGYARFWLVEYDGTVCGTFGLSLCGPLMRVKNIAVHPGFRHRGVGRSAIAFALERAWDEGCDWVGAFAFPDGAGARLYAGCGFETVGWQTEWSRPVPMAAPGQQPSTLVRA